MYGRKYHNTKVKTPDGVFDSKAELKRWQELKAREAAGEITDLQRQVEFLLVPKQELKRPIKQPNGRTKRSELPVKYIADFVYYKDGERVVEDAKGMQTPEYIIKRKLMLKMLDIQVEEIKRNGRS